MTWQEVCNNKSLQDLPYKIELNHWGKIEMSPAKNYHSFFQWAIQRQLYEINKSGYILPECPIQTEDNVKVADVAWVSKDRGAIIKNEEASSIAPEICVEVISDSNTYAEMMFKKDLYLKAGALEFWLCDQEENITFYNRDGKINNSLLFPEFPNHIEV